MGLHLLESKIRPISSPLILPRGIALAARIAHPEVGTAEDIESHKMLQACMLNIYK